MAHPTQPPPAPEIFLIPDPSDRGGLENPGYSEYSPNEDDGGGASCSSAFEFEMLEQIEDVLSKKFNNNEEGSRSSGLIDFSRLESVDFSNKDITFTDRGSIHIYDTPEPLNSPCSTLSNSYPPPTQSPPVPPPLRLEFSEFRHHESNCPFYYYREKRTIHFLCGAVAVLLLLLIVVICLLIFKFSSSSVTEVDEPKLQPPYSSKFEEEPDYAEKSSSIATKPYPLCNSVALPKCFDFENYFEKVHVILPEDVKIYTFRHVTYFPFSSLVDVPYNEAVKGHAFTTVRNHVGFTWQIWLYPSVHRQIDHSWNYGGSIGAYFKYLDGPFKDLNVTFSIFVKDLNGVFRSEKAVFSQPIERGGQGWGFAKFLTGNLTTLIREKVTLEQNPGLNIGIDLEITEDYFKPLQFLRNNRKESSNNKKSFVAKKKEREEFKHVACGLEGKNANFLLISAEKYIFHCHKNILARGSPYFQHIFENSSKKIKKGNFKFSTGALREVLQYIYLNCTSNNLHNVADEVLRISDSFRLPKLFERLHELLLYRLSIQNCVRTLVLADRYQLDTLLNVSGNFVLDYWDSIGNATNSLPKELYKKLMQKASFRLKASTFL